MVTLAWALGGYLCGSIPFAILVSRAMGLPDPRTYGSGNIGTTNVLRSGSRMAALLTLVGDAGKGWVAVLAASLAQVDAVTVSIVAFCAVLGHVFPVWLNWRGGKGVATAAGVLLALDWRVGLGVLAAWLVVVAATRYSSLAALVAAVAAPFVTWYFLGEGPQLLAVLAMAALLVLRHKANIGKLLRGEESRIGEKKPAPAHQGKE